MTLKEKMTYLRQQDTSLLSLKGWTDTCASAHEMGPKMEKKEIIEMVKYDHKTGRFEKFFPVPLCHDT